MLYGPIHTILLLIVDSDFQSLHHSITFESTNTNFFFPLLPLLPDESFILIPTFHGSFSTNSFPVESP